MSNRPILEIRDLSFGYGAENTISNLNINVEEGEFLCLLGPSGSGKTTTLKLIAGFEFASSGDIVVQGQAITKTPAHKRNLGMVFQNYSLFPHMTVRENLMYGLKRRKLPKDEIDQQVALGLETVELGHKAEMYPGALSGGEQQRIGLARALIIKPSLLLLDEPLSNLDAVLRRSMARTIRKIHEEYKLTSVYVTHDQEEAMMLGDRIAVMREGEIRQLSQPRDLYERPSDRFVASFIGQRNIFPGVVTRVGADEYDIEISGNGDPWTVTAGSSEKLKMQQKVELCILTDRILVESGPNNRAAEVKGRVASVLYTGPGCQIIVNSSFGDFNVQLSSDEADRVGVEDGKDMWFGFKSDSVWAISR